MIAREIERLRLRVSATEVELWGQRHRFSPGQLARLHGDLCEEIGRLRTLKALWSAMLLGRCFARAAIRRELGRIDLALTSIASGRPLSLAERS